MPRVRPRLVTSSCRCGCKPHHIPTPWSAPGAVSRRVPWPASLFLAGTRRYHTRSSHSLVPRGTRPSGRGGVRAGPRLPVVQISCNCPRPGEAPACQIPRALAVRCAAGPRPADLWRARRPIGAKLRCFSAESVAVVSRRSRRASLRGTMTEARSALSSTWSRIGRVEASQGVSAMRASPRPRRPPTGGWLPAARSPRFHVEHDGQACSVSGRHASVGGSAMADAHAAGGAASRGPCCAPGAGGRGRDNSPIRIGRSTWNNLRSRGARAKDRRFHSGDPWGPWVEEIPCRC